MSDSVSGSTHTVTWVTDQSEMAFNVVAGRYAVKRGAGTALFYHPSHTYNVDEMLETLNASRRWYGDAR